MKKGRAKILVINLAEAGVGTAGVLAAEALSRHPHLEVHSIHDERAAASPLQGRKLQGLPGLKVRTRRRHDLAWSYLRIWFYCLKFRPHVVHDLNGSGYRKNLPLWCWWALTSRLVLTEHTPSHDRHRSWVFRMARQTAYQLGHAFVVFGPASRSSLQACGVKDGKIFESRLGHNGFYGEMAGERPRRDPRTVLFFGELRPQKGFELLLPIADAVRRLCPETNVRFVVAGSPAQSDFGQPGWRQRVQEILEVMRARPDFEVHAEYIPDEKVGRFFQEAGLVLVPYREANQSAVALTAMALGCPVIAAPVGDIPSVIRDGENGLLRPAEAEAFAQAVVELVRDPQRAQTLAEQAGRDMEAQFSWDKTVGHYPGAVYGLTMGKG